jgi:uncharacterized protein CbrC (UPF0167 family)
METLPTFSLFPDPTRERVFKKTDAPCGVCGQSRGVLYDGPAYGPSPVSETPVCPWCIASGDAGRLGVIFNDSCTQSSNPATTKMSDADRDLVEHRTPGFTTWQGNHWAACCGRACVYLGEADAADLKGRWAEAVPSMFADLGYSTDEIAETVDGVAREGSPAAYVFQCQVCKALQGYWDCD